MAIHAKIISLVEIKLSWMHKDKDHQENMEDILYKVTCNNHSQDIIQESTRLNYLTLNHLTPGVKYTCNISLPSALSECYEASQVAFTIPGMLE